MAAPFWIYKKANLWHFPELGSVYKKARACLENHSRNLYAPPYGTFINKYYFIIAKCKSFVNRKHWN